LEILQEACTNALTPKNITSAWVKTGLFPFNPEVVLSELPAVKLKREKEAAEAQQPPQPPSRPTTSGHPALLIIAIPQNVADVQALVKTSDKIKERLASITVVQEQIQTDLLNLQLCIQKLGNSATTAITETKLTQTVNQELIEQDNQYKNCKKVSKKDKDKITDTRVLSHKGIDRVLEAKAARKKAAEEELAKQKRLKALYKL
jgi:hypothetical protein